MANEGIRQQVELVDATVRSASLNWAVGEHILREEQNQGQTKSDY